MVKSFECPYLKCKKEYASTLALNLHIKIKHNGGNKKERDLLAVIDFIYQSNQL